MVRALYAQAMELLLQKKPVEAARLLSSFESLAYPKALYTLGCLYEFGGGMITANKDEAFKLYNKSAKMGYADERTAYKSKILKMIKKTNKK